MEKRTSDKENWMTAYKLMRLGKDGQVYPLFINKKEPTRFGVDLKAECYPTPGFQVRQGYHACFIPYAPHLKENLASGEKRVWVQIKVNDWVTYERPVSQGGKWILAQKMNAERILSYEEVIDILNLKRREKI